MVRRDVHPDNWDFLNEITYCFNHLANTIMTMHVDVGFNQDANWNQLFPTEV